MNITVDAHPNKQNRALMLGIGALFAKFKNTIDALYRPGHPPLDNTLKREILQNFEMCTHILRIKCGIQEEDADTLDNLLDMSDVTGIKEEFRKLSENLYEFFKEDIVIAFQHSTIAPSEVVLSTIEDISKYLQLPHLRGIYVVDKRRLELDLINAFSKHYGHDYAKSEAYHFLTKNENILKYN